MIKLASMISKVVSYPKFILRVNNRGPIKTVVFIYLYGYNTIWNFIKWFIVNPVCAYSQICLAEHTPACLCSLSQAHLSCSSLFCAWFSSGNPSSSSGKTSVTCLCRQPQVMLLALFPDKYGYLSLPRNEGQHLCHWGNGDSACTQRVFRFRWGIMLWEEESGFFSDSEVGPT